MAIRNYIKSEEKKWKEWTIKQRLHFLKDHKIKEAANHMTSEFKELTNEIKDAIKKHLKEGAYKGGGNIKPKRVYNKKSGITKKEAGGNISEYKDGDEVSFYHVVGKDKTKKTGFITGKTPKGDFIISTGFSEMSVAPEHIIEKVLKKKREKILGIFKDGGNVPRPENATKNIYRLINQLAIIGKNIGSASENRNGFFDFRIGIENLIPDENLISETIDNYKKNKIKSIQEPHKSQIISAFDEFQNSIEEYDIEKISKEISEIDSEIAGLEEKRNKLQEKLTKHKAKGLLDNVEKNPIHQLNQEQKQFITSSLHKYGNDDDKNATLENLHSANIDHIKKILSEIKHKHLTEYGQKILSEIFEKLK